MLSAPAKAVSLDHMIDVPLKKKMLGGNGRTAQGITRFHMSNSRSCSSQELRPAMIRASDLETRKCYHLVIQHSHGK